MPLRKLIGANIRKLRKQRGMNGADLARALHVAQSTVSQWESGGKTPRAVMIQKIADLFGVSVAAITSEEKEGVTDLKELLESGELLTFKGKALRYEHKRIFIKILGAILDDE